MNENNLTLALMLLNGLLQRAAQFSARINSGETIDNAALDELVKEDEAARLRQVEALERARAEGR